MNVQVFSLSDTGRVRAHNEDAVHTCVLPDGSNLLVLCDGMGGHAAGDVASRTAVEAVVQALCHGPTDHDPVPALHEAIQAAQRAVMEASALANGSNMGTTLVLALRRDDLVWFGWVGDSRAYLFRDGAVIDRSEDHTRVAELVRRGVIRPEEARNHPDAHILTRAIGGGSLDLAQPTVWHDPTRLLPGDVVLLCSDGVHDLIEDHDLARWATSQPPEQAAHHIAKVVHDRGAHDNLTLAILAVPGSAPVRSRVHAGPRRTIPDTNASAPAVAPPGDAAAPPPSTPHAVSVEGAHLPDAPPAPDAHRSRLGMIALALAGSALALFILLILGLALFLAGRALLSDAVKLPGAPTSNLTTAVEEPA